ncbi:MAG: ANTAR domain-containing protein [Betaproteobacteria bacterium]|nr:MAG: ANTAR domain-containing protein [Betaproteobacteria bacterium]
MRTFFAWHQSILTSNAHRRTSRLQILLLHDSEHDIARLEAVLLESGHYLCSVCANARTLAKEVERHRPDLLLIATDDPSRDMVEQICVQSQFRERPIVMLTESDDPQAMRAAVSAGVAAYVVAGFKPERMSAVLDVALLRFNHEREQFASIAAAERREAEQATIGKAKAWLRRQGLSENEAYAQLRATAMRERCTIAEVAERVVGA